MATVEPARRARLAVFIVDLSENTSMVSELSLETDEMELALRRLKSGEEGRELRATMLCSGIVAALAGRDGLAQIVAQIPVPPVSLAYVQVGSTGSFSSSVPGAGCFRTQLTRPAPGLPLPRWVAACLGRSRGAQGVSGRLARLGGPAADGGPDALAAYCPAQRPPGCGRATSAVASPAPRLRGSARHSDARARAGSAKM
jgi:hypothetical protein